MIYDLPANYVTHTTGDIIMNMQVGEMGMTMNLKAKTLLIFSHYLDGQYSTQMSNSEKWIYNPSGIVVISGF